MTVTMAILNLINILIIAMITTTSVGKSQDPNDTVCHKTSDVLSFSKDLNADMDFERIGRFEQITCCANNFVGDVEWFQKNKDGTMNKFAPTINASSNYVFHERHQLLSIKNISMADNGTYVCVASNGTQNVSFDYTLNVIDCEYDAGEVRAMKQPPKVQHAAIGETFTLECLGYFGCANSDNKFVIWMHHGFNQTDLRTLEGHNDFYSVTAFNKSNDTILGSNLTFKTTSEENFTGIYTCLLSVPEPYALSFDVKLERKATIKVFPQWLLYTIIAVASVIVLSVLVLTVDRLWGPQIVFRAQTKLNIGWPSRRDEVAHDICLLSSCESAAFVSSNIYQVLQDFGYNVFYHYEEHTEGGLDTSIQLDGLTHSSHVLLYLSSEEEVEEFREFFVQSSIRLVGGSRIIIIHEGSLKKSLQTLKPDIQEKLEIVRSVRWPCSENRDSREFKNFWCLIRRYLPQPQSDEIEGRHSSVTHEPLLENEIPNGGNDDPFV